jgi:hypothetical protein
LEKIGNKFQEIGKFIQRSISPAIQVNTNKLAVRAQKQPTTRDSVQSNTSKNQSLRSKISFGSRDLETSRFRGGEKSGLATGFGSKVSTRSNAIQDRSNSSKNTKVTFAFKRI